MRASSLLGEISAEDFLRDYWQKRPALFRKGATALPALEVARIIALARDPDVESRRVTRQGAGWALEHGPFTQSDLAPVLHDASTLLVSDLEQHLAEVEPLLDAVDFLPSWRIDDVMASVSGPGGSVGPHYDSYDVFLVQGAGHKRWQITTEYEPKALLPDCDLRILERFDAQQEWLLEPGDVLYLPPHVAHYGIAESASVTYSVGCRAPSQRELVTHFAIDAIDRASDEPAHRDPDLSLGEPRHEISDRARDAMLGALRAHFEVDPGASRRCLAALLSQPKALFADDQPDLLDEEESRDIVERAEPLRRFRGSRWLSVRDEAATHLFINGEQFPIACDAEVARELCVRRHFPHETLRTWNANEARRDLLRGLVSAGFLTPLGR